jgi:hypothetical protein
MPEESSSNQSPPFNLNTILALLTLAGGVWLVSNKLTSSRPVVPAGGTQPFIGEQTLEARLWEDPFKAEEPGREPKSAGETNGDLLFLVDQIRERNETPNKVLLLPVMLAGGHYGEDQESRIRSRNAVVSALAQSGYAPEDAEHLGALTIHWPTRHEVDKAREGTSPAVACLWVQGINAARQLGTNMAASARMDLRYEWYHREDSIPRSKLAPWTSVLVLWLDDSFFEDEPLLRLALLLNPLGPSGVPIHLIGPRRSATLHAMLKGFPATTNADIKTTTTNTFTNVSIYCATPSAMDDVLVALPKNKPPFYETPRQAVSNQFVSLGFSSFHNFAATDDQLAREAYSELALSDLELSDTSKHLVLISEWDTFYARALSLTYAAELDIRQQQHKTRRQYLDKVAMGYPGPTNFHSFYYYRGLDGQTVKGEGQAEESQAEDRAMEKAFPGSFEELRTWKPDGNKAEGRAQFDYLNRLCDQLADLRTSLHRSERGKIEAIGVVGSDVYDILLILQALHDRFPDVKFFTTDLDARFCQPRERRWTRDLLVLSAYGLQLHPDLQRSIPAFRDSTQTAQFAAALAALGHANLNDLTLVPPRRFEVGNGAIVDLSVLKALMPSTSRIGSSTNGPWLHPLTLSEEYPYAKPHIHEHSIKIVIYSLVLLIAAGLFWLPLRGMAAEPSRIPGDILAYSEEDVGGPEGVRAMLKQPETSRDWKVFEPPGPGPGGPPTEHDCEQQAKALVLRLNQALNGNESLPALESDWNQLRPRFVPIMIWRALARLMPRYPRRCTLDATLLRLSSHADRTPEALLAATTARESTWEVIRLRAKRLFWWWGGVVGFLILAGAMGYGIWWDTLKGPTGEPFSLTKGASGWPAEILRLLICFTAIFYVLRSYRQLREAFFRLTRQFRLALSKQPEPKSLRELPGECWREATFFLRRLKPPADAEGVRAETIWQKYREHGRGSRRLMRIAIPAAFYLALCKLTFWVFETDPYDDVRGEFAYFVNHVLVVASGVLFVVLAFLVVDAALLCRRFIQELGTAPTKYPEATFKHFSRAFGNLQPKYVDEWIDLQLIAELTERVGKLVYCPCWMLLALALARNGWWDTLTWNPALILVYAFSVVLALASAVTLQLAAKHAKREAERSLDKKVRQLEAEAAPSAEQNQANQAARLLEEIRNLRRGAFVSFWQNPIVGAITASSGSMTLIQLVIWLMGR